MVQSVVCQLIPAHTGAGVVCVRWQGVNDGLSLIPDQSVVHHPTKGKEHLVLQQSGTEDTEEWEHSSNKKSSDISHIRISLFSRRLISKQPQLC